MTLIFTLWLLLGLGRAFCQLSSHGPTTFNVPISRTESGYRTVTLSLGTPPQEFNLWLDTGSDPTCVLSQSCIEPCSISDAKRTAYIPSESSTNNATGETLHVDYLGGAVAGCVSLWMISTSVHTSPPFGYSNRAWLDADGMLGLAFPRVEEPVHASFLESLFHPEILEAHEFAIYTGQYLSPNNGVVRFGGHNTEYNSTDVTYFNIQRYIDDNNAIIYWTTYINRVDFNLNVDGATHSNTVFVENFAVWDTGSSHITVPETYIYTFIQEGGRPLCEDVRKLDFKMTIILPEGTITVRPADLIVPGFTEEQYCWPLFEPSSSGRWIIGMDLIRNFYTVWDLGGWDIRSDELQPRLGNANIH
ncbi:aspartic peptidase domain-containing protein [Desarmillaria tabescens]|uniref:Aspartic peptidase domain-containing protein n=1 Tax=Armillaria tabescens TaxID=1929756 RepID=A0AA39JRB2_ARMTA|nr:aspartic peptidase domain-containing protein [Desarmillaria tabescens]KAK0446034.1 aspartic peptidase domain-containing protein [Desarmillaria tabescens]